MGVSEDHYSTCPNATEKCLIINKTKLTIPAEAIICPKHRLKYDLGWKSPMSCQYPDHKVGKQKPSSKRPAMRFISPRVNLQIQLLFSSAVKRAQVPIGSKWCNNYRLRDHCGLLKYNKHILASPVCKVCLESHIRKDAIENTNNNDPPLLQEQVPADDYSNSAIMLSPVLTDEADELSSDDHFSDENRKDSFNKSMSSI